MPQYAKIGQPSVVGKKLQFDSEEEQSEDEDQNTVKPLARNESDVKVFRA